MKILTLIIKQVYFDQIMAGTKKTETREIRAKGASKYIQYIDDAGNIYKKDTDIPEDVDADFEPVKYDAIRFYVGYNKDRDTALVEVKGAKVFISTDEDDKEIVYEYEGKEYLAAEIDYKLGKIIE